MNYPREQSSNRRPLVLMAALVLCTAGFYHEAVEANEFELLRLASELNYASTRLADELRYERGYNNMRISANRLGRESEQLVEAIRRNRSPSYVRTQFRDVSRRYDNLENDFMRARRRNDLWLVDSVGLISNLYLNLSDQFYYTRYVEPASRDFYLGISSGDRYYERSGKDRRSFKSRKSRKGKSGKGHRRDRHDSGRGVYFGFSQRDAGTHVERAVTIESPRGAVRVSETNRRSSYH